MIIYDKSLQTFDYKRELFTQQSFFVLLGSVSTYGYLGPKFSFSGTTLCKPPELNDVACLVIRHRTSLTIDPY